MHRLALAAALLAPTPAVAGSPIEPHLADAESYTETTTVIADLEDGTYVQAQLAVSNLGMGDGKGACRLLVISAGGVPWTRAAQSDGEWRFSDKPVPRLVIGTCQLVAGRSLVVDFTLEGATVHLDLDARARAIAPPGNSIGGGDDFYTYEILVPWAAVRARVSLPDGRQISSEGRGYADHSRSTMMPADLARSWVRFRGLGGDCPTLILVRTPPDGASEGWRWPGNESGPRPLAPRVRLPGKAGDAVVLTATTTMTIRPTATLYRHAPLEEYALAGLVRNWIGSPETTTYRAILEGGPCGAPVKGILEITTVAR